MANRPYFYVKDHRVCCDTVQFEWYPGFAISQKQKTVASMHSAIKKHGHNPLEISTKSPIKLGQRLSAFNLKLDGYYLENVFQSSKVFRSGGPYRDLLTISPKEAKRDERIRQSGELIKFSYNDEDWQLMPRTAFYDYIYYHAVRQCMTSEDLNELTHYNAFTDIEFNPKRSINTQARSIAIVEMAYLQHGYLPDMNQEEFIHLHKQICR